MNIALIVIRLVLQLVVFILDVPVVVVEWARRLPGWFNAEVKWYKRRVSKIVNQVEKHI